MWFKFNIWVLKVVYLIVYDKYTGIVLYEVLGT